MVDNHFEEFLIFSPNVGWAQSSKVLLCDRSDLIDTNNIFCNFCILFRIVRKSKLIFFGDFWYFFDFRIERLFLIETGLWNAMNFGEMLKIAFLGEGSEWKVFWHQKQVTLSLMKRKPKQQSVPSFKSISQRSVQSLYKLLNSPKIPVWYPSQIVIKQI